MPLLKLSDLPEIMISKGIRANAINTDNQTVAHVHIDQGAIVPEHAHVHEQIVNVVEGQLELTVDGQTYLLEAGKVMVLPSNVPHSGRALTDVKVIDVFCPAREDFRGSSFAGYPGDSNR